jgi:hypothetical protein
VRIVFGTSDAQNEIVLSQHALPLFFDLLDESVGFMRITNGEERIVCSIGNGVSESVPYHQEMVRYPWHKMQTGQYASECGDFAVTVHIDLIVFDIPGSPFALTRGQFARCWYLISRSCFTLEEQIQRKPGGLIMPLSLL